MTAALRSKTLIESASRATTQSTFYFFNRVHVGRAPFIHSSFTRTSHDFFTRTPCHFSPFKFVSLQGDLVDRSCIEPACFDPCRRSGASELGQKRLGLAGDGMGAVGDRRRRRGPTGTRRRYGSRPAMELLCTCRQTHPYPPNLRLVRAGGGGSSGGGKAGGCKGECWGGSNLESEFPTLKEICWGLDESVIGQERKKKVGSLSSSRQ